MSKRDDYFDFIDWLDDWWFAILMSFIGIAFILALTLTYTGDHRLRPVHRIERRLERQEYRHAVKWIKLEQRWGDREYETYGTISQSTIDRLADKGYTAINIEHERNADYNKYRITW